MSKSFEINQQSFTKDHGEIILYQRADHKKPKWQTRIKIKGATGYVRKSCGTTNEFEARQFAESLYDSLVAKFRVTGSTQTKTFLNVVDEWLRALKEEEKKPEVIKEFKSRLYNYPVRHWGHTYIDKLQNSDLVEFINWRKANGKKKKRPSGTTIRKDLVPLKQVFDYAYGKKYISRQLKFEKLSAKSERRPDFTENDWKAVIQNLDDWIEKSERHPRSYRDRVYLKYFILIVGNTGIRPGSESRALTWSCFDYHRFYDMEREQFVIRIPKGKVSARWAVPDKVVVRYLKELKQFRKEEVLRLNKAFNEDEPIFCHEDGKVIHTFKKGFKAFLNNYGLLCDKDGNERVLYSLRHTFATRYIRSKKINHWDLAKNMGTSVEELERHYAHDDHTEYGKKFINFGAPTAVTTLEKFIDQ